jgi:hypothetical protein
VSSKADSVRSRIAQREAFTRNEIIAFTAVENDLDLWSAVYEAICESDSCIQREIGMSITYSFVIRYLLRCVRENMEPDHIHSGYEAAWELASCLKFLASKLPETESTIRFAEREMANEFISGDENIRDRLINGTLEHALELIELRPFFAHWADNFALNNAWRQAMEWANDHTE